MSFLYSIFLLFWFVGISVKYSYYRIRYKKYHNILLFKLGIRRQKITLKKDRKCIWIHASSFGEALSTKSLLKGLKLSREDYHIVFSCFTSDGYNLAKTLDGIDQVIILPIDLKSSMTSLTKKIQPDIFILIESDYWLNLLKAVKHFGARVILVGGRVSDRSFKRLTKFMFFTHHLFSKFDYLLLQDHIMEEKFLALGLEKKKIKVIGNLKIDTDPKKYLEKDLLLSKDKKYITLGSTQKDEEVLLLNALKNLSSEYSFILAPRKPARFAEVQNLLEAMDISWRYSSEKGSGKERVVYVNKLGVLEQCYSYSELAIVGGSFFPETGGHNVYEPVRLGAPVIYGLNTYNQKSLTKVVEAYGVGTATDIDNLYSVVERVLKKGRISPLKLEEIKSSSEGATAKAIKLINSLV